MSTRKVRRQIPLLKISLQKGASYDALMDIPDLKELVMKTVVEAIQEGVSKDRKSITLFDIYDSDYRIDLDRKEWVSSLNKAIDYYVELEDYTCCSNIKSMIDKIESE